MKITELVGIKNKVSTLPKDPTFTSIPYGTDPGPGGRNRPLGQEWHNVMIANGFKPLGSGMFGTVWEHPKLSYVLKVFAADDQAYIDWIHTAIQHKTNPHMPQFVSPKPRPIVSGVVAVRMEKLNSVERGGRMVMYQSEVFFNGQRGFDLPSEEVKALGFLQDQQNLRRYCQDYPHWLDALDILKQFMNNTGHRLDFHGGNIMNRDQFTLVITDPVFESNARDKRPQ